MSSFYVCGVKLTHTNAPSAARALTKALLSQKKQSVCFTPNLHILTAAKKSKRLCRLLQSADILLPDGAGVCSLCRLCGCGHIPRITGIDMGHFLLQYAARHGLRVYLLGGKPSVAERAAKRLADELPVLNIVGTHHGYFDKAPSSNENQAVLRDIKKARPDLLFVCFGFPLQELWITQSLAALPSVRLSMGLGGSLDVWSGDIRRAPLPLRILNLEWLWRTTQWTRGCGDAVAFREKLRKSFQRINN